MRPGNEARPPEAPKLTYADFLSFPDDGLRHELIDGEQYVTPSPSERHQRLSVRLVRVLGDHLEATGLGQVYHAPFDVVLSDHDVVEPDLLVVLNDQLDVLTPQHVRGAPAIVIEILSAGTRRRDETLKRSLYAHAGIRGYWMIDPDSQAITVCRAAGGAEFDSTTILRASTHDVLTSELLPGFSLDLTRLFQDRSTVEPSVQG